MRVHVRFLSVAGAFATLLLAGTPAGAYTTAASAIATLSAQGIMAGGPGYPGRAAMSPVDLASILGRFETRTGHQGNPGTTLHLRHANRVTRDQGLVDILRATGLSRTSSGGRNRRIASRIGMLAGVPGMQAGGGTLTRGQVAVMLVNLEHYWQVNPTASGSSGTSGSLLEGTVTAVNTQPGTLPVGSSGSISVQTSTGVSTVNLSSTATIQQAGQSIPLSQVTMGAMVEIQLAANGEGQLVDVLPAGTVPSTPASTTSATRGTVVSLSNGQLTLQPQARGASAATYSLSSTVVVTAQGQGSSLANVATGDLIQVHLSGGTVTWINVLATAGSTTGTITSALYGAFIVTESSAQTVRVLVRPTTTVTVDGIDLPHTALARGEEVAVTGTTRNATLLASSITITGDATPGVP